MNFELICSSSNSSVRLVYISSFYMVLMKLFRTPVGMEDWFQLIIACYPFSAVEGLQSLKPGRSIGSDERKLLYELFQKQRHVAGGSAIINQLPVVQMLLSKLMLVSVGYCWKEFSYEDWDFLLSNLRSWIQSVAVMMEDIAENVDALVDNASGKRDVLTDKLEQIVLISDSIPIKIAENALLSFLLYCQHLKLKQDEEKDNFDTLKFENLNSVMDRVSEGILRILFCTGISESIANSYCKEAALLVTSSRVEYKFFWESVACCVVKSSSQARERAVKSVEFWGLSKGSVSSLYSVLFSSKTIPLLQFAAYFILSTEPVLSMAIVEDNTSNLDVKASSNQDAEHLDISLEESVHLKEEISCMIQREAYEVFETDLLAPQRVRILYMASTFS